jgi:hypothetical protein
VEGWENKVLEPSGDEVFEARLVHKYGGLKWFDPDKRINFTAHPDKMHFEKMRWDNQYWVFGVMDGFNYSLDEYHASNVNLWEPWLFSEDFVEQITLYYKDSTDGSVIQRSLMSVKVMKSKMEGVGCFM